MKYCWTVPNLKDLIMQFHFKIPQITDFYLTISRENPYRQTEIVTVDQRHPAPTEADEMERCLDRTNMWIGNCDQKASFLLALVGVVITIIFTCGAASKINDVLVSPLITYWKNDIGSFCFWRMVDALLLIAGMALVFVSMIYLLLCLMAKTDYSQFQQPGMEQRSHLFYGHIASMTYDEFCHTTVDKFNDLRSQVYTNSIICNDKFKNYRKGAKAIMWSLPILSIAFLLLLFI